MISKNQRIQCLESWHFELLLSTRAERRKAIESTNDDDQREYYKALINRNKKQSAPSKRILTFKY